MSVRTEATAATLEQVGDVRLEFGEDSESCGESSDVSMLASSHLLRLASPVFNGMLQSGMKEAQQSVIKVVVATKQEFMTFYNLLGLWAWSTDKVTKDNVDSLLAISDYYQVDIIKDACVKLLLTLPVTGARLLQAHKHGLKEQYQRCIDHLAGNSTNEDLTVLRSEPDILLEVALRKQEVLNPSLILKRARKEIEKCREAAIFDSDSSDDEDDAKNRKRVKKVLTLVLTALK
ncbi:unnamed protein product [Symbiodinium natans]|uniref:BTB domain-containing protein n=1 Tax=Symbiodinium natans TaxID=878477 RepID=A0A812SQ84_9DINO|nr:unnamed protein product [Symbiodinium natans]